MKECSQSDYLYRIQRREMEGSFWGKRLGPKKWKSCECLDRWIAEYFKFSF